jgi:hypothetical protein
MPGAAPRDLQRRCVQRDVPPLLAFFLFAESGAFMRSAAPA